MRRLLRTLSKTMGFAALLLAAGCSEPITSPSAPDLVALSVVPAESPYGEVAVGGYHNCALKTDGTVVCWGRNFAGQSTPPSGLIAVQVSAGGDHTCALKGNGEVVCWGNNAWGQTNVPAGLLATNVGAGGAHTCAVRTDATVVCWGVPAPVDDKGQTTVPAGLTSVSKVVAGMEHTCALKTDGTVVCWGSNGNGQTDVPSGLVAVHLSGRWLHTCGARADGTGACWGYGPLAAMPAGVLASEISPGNAHTCALRTDATVTCWGYNAQPLPESWAQFGQTDVPPGLTSVAHVGSGAFHTCALKTDGTVVCWGMNENGQINVPTGLNLITTQPQAVTITSTPPVPAVVGGSYALTATGGGSGNPVTFGSLTSTTCSVTGSAVSFLAAGACTITADQGGNANYFPAPQATQGMTVVEANVAPVITRITLPGNPVPLGTSVGVTADFTDANQQDSHTGTLAWDDGTSSIGQVGESNGAGTVSGAHSYLAAGVYTTGVTVSDGSLTGTRSSELDIPSYIVVYDPSAGFVTGGGWITSPAGAYPANPALTGKASFGFVSKYKKGKTIPEGNTEFQFHAAAFNFSSSTYQWLVIAGSKAQYKGDGTVNGAGTYGFLLTAIDGDLAGGGSADRFRIKIWDKATGAVVYDNKMGSLEDSSDATVLGGGSIVMHK